MTSCSPPNSIRHPELATASNESSGPIGVFDSGVGGLSILQALRDELPFEDFVYLSDSGHAPYGERDDTHVIARSRIITAQLRARHGIKALVIACNTATAAAIAVLRQEHPDLPIIGVEPALKPAIALSKTRRIGVLATRGTLTSAKFGALMASLADQAQFVCQPCDGLAAAIERHDASKTLALCTSYTSFMGQFGSQDGQIDTLVLGCTHYPFASEHFRQLVGPAVHLVDNGAPVARQTRRLLGQSAASHGVGQLALLCTGDPQALTAAARRWLGVNITAQQVLAVA